MLFTLTGVLYNLNSKKFHCRSFRLFKTGCRAFRHFMNILNLRDMALFHIFIVTVSEDSASSCTLELVRASNSFSDTTPTVWIKGDCWPPYKEIITRYPLCGAAKLKVFVDCVEGPSVLTFGLISPHDRYLQFPFIFNHSFIISILFL